VDRHERLASGFDFGDGRGALEELHESAEWRGIKASRLSVTSQIGEGSRAFLAVEVASENTFGAEAEVRHTINDDPAALEPALVMILSAPLQHELEDGDHDQGDQQHPKGDYDARVLRVHGSPSGR
jgi:hypothetical protein